MTEDPGKGRGAHEAEAIRLGLEPALPENTLQIPQGQVIVFKIPDHIFHGIAEILSDNGGEGIRTVGHETVRAQGQVPHEAQGEGFRLRAFRKGRQAEQG